MKIIPRDNTEIYSLPLPMYTAIHVADAIGRDGAEFDVLVGLSKTYVDQLRKLSADESDTDLQNFTGDKRRFVIGTYEYWYQKNRSIFALVHKPTDDLAAVIWFGPKPIGRKSDKFGATIKPTESERKFENEWHTVSFRSYPGYRGRGLMKNFALYALHAYKTYFPHVKFWTGTDDRNTTFVKFITELGFKENEENSDMSAHWLIMTKV